MWNIRALRFVAMMALGFSAIRGAHAANAVDDAKAMLAAGDGAAAVSTLDVYLQRNPKDLDARFARGLALARTGRSAEAIQVFTELAKALPTAAEPYNNLAALYAAKGDLIKAHTALENALTRNPNSLSGRLNLGDVYLALARQEYRRALELDGANAMAKSRVTAIAELQGVTPSPVMQASVPLATQRATASVGVAFSPTAASIAPLVPAPTAVPVAAAAGALQSKPGGDGWKPPQSIAGIDQKSLVSFLQRWVRASSEGDANAYLSLYATNFQPTKGSSRGKWLEETRKFLATSKQSKSTISAVRFRPIGDNVLLEFQHEMQSGSTVTKKTRSLELVSVGPSEWRVIRESE